MAINHGNYNEIGHMKPPAYQLPPLWSVKMSVKDPSKEKRSNLPRVSSYTDRGNNTQPRPRLDSLSSFIFSRSYTDVTSCGGDLATNDGYQVVKSSNKVDDNIPEEQADHCDGVSVKGDSYDKEITGDEERWVYSSDEESYSEDENSMEKSEKQNTRNSTESLDSVGSKGVALDSSKDKAIGHCKSIETGDYSVDTDRLIRRNHKVEFLEENCQTIEDIMNTSIREPTDTEQVEDHYFQDAFYESDCNACENDQRNSTRKHVGNNKNSNSKKNSENNNSTNHKKQTSMYHTVKINFHDQNKREKKKLPKISAKKTGKESKVLAENEVKMRPKFTSTRTSIALPVLLQTSVDKLHSSRSGMESLLCL